MATAAPFKGVLEMQTVQGDTAGSPGYVISRPMYFDDAAAGGSFAQFLDDSSYEYIAEADLWLTDIKINPSYNGTTGAPVTPAANTTDVQLYLKSNPVRYENWIVGLLTTTLVRPRPFFVAKGTKIQLKQLIR